MRHIYIRDPYSFSDIEMKVIEKRVLKVKENGQKKFTVREPEVYSDEEFSQRLSDVGEVTRYEQYICPFTGIYVIRGSVRKEDNKEYFFSLYTHNNEIYKVAAQNVISCLQYSGN